MNLIERLTNAANDLRNVVMNDLHAVQDGAISSRDARTRASLAKVALDALKIEVMGSPLAYGYIRKPESAPQLAAAE